MKKYIFFSPALLLAMLLSTCAEQSPVGSFEKHFDKVVVIKTNKVCASGFYTGTGFFVGPETIACSAHAFKDDLDSAQIITLDSMIYTGRLIFIDPLIDIAFLSVVNAPCNVYFDIDGQKPLYKRNQVVCAISHPKGVYTWSTIYGFWDTGSDRDSLIKYDMFVVGGMSGSSIITQDGQLQGMLVQGGTKQAENFAKVIPTYWIQQKYKEMQK